MFVGSITLQGHTAQDKTTLVFPLQGIDYTAATLGLNQVRGALVDVTKAFIKEVKISEVLESDATRPSDTSADTFEEAAISTFLNLAADAEKLHTVRIPAPIEALFMGDASTVLTSNALLIQFIQQLADHTTLSDGETIKDANNNGIKSGYKRSRARKFINKVT